jgi:hypothetical protein
VLWLAAGVLATAAQPPASFFFNAEKSFSTIVA